MPSPSPRLYDQLADLWPLLSPPEDHAAEAELIAEVLTAHGCGAPGRRRPAIVEFGAGGGHTLHHLAGRFDAVAVDLSEPMLGHCRRLNPAIATHVGDMRTVRLGRRFDAVLVHDAADYLTRVHDIEAACATAAAHLGPGGLVLLAPTYVRESFRDHETTVDRHRRGRMDITCVSHVQRRARRGSSYDLVLLLLIRSGGRLRIEEDRHRCGLYAARTWRSALTRAGFQVRGHEATDADARQPPWHLFVGVRG